MERKRKRPKLNSQQFPNILSPSATCWSCWIHVIATCSSGGYFPKIVEWSFLQQGRSVWRKIPGKKRKPFVTGFRNKLQINEAMKKFGRISELRFGELWEKKCQQVSGEQWEEEKGGSLPYFLFPSHLSPRAFIFPSPQLPFDTRGPRGGGRKDPKNENAGPGVGSKIFRRDWIDYFRH